MANNLTPAQRAAFDQQSAEIRDHVLMLVKMFRETAQLTDVFTAQSAVATGLILAQSPTKAISIALMAITLLAEQDEK